MKLTQKKIYLVIGLTALSLIGLVTIQTSWISGAIKLKEEQFDQQVQTALVEASKGIKDDTLLLDQLKKLPQNYWLAQEKRDSLLLGIRTHTDSVFRKANIPLNYEFGVIPFKRTRDNSILLASNAEWRNDFFNSPYKGCSYLFNDLASLSLVFPDKESFLISKIATLAAASILFVLIISACFAYIIITIRKQKKLSEIKNDFINNLTHEFKTPVFSISLASKVLNKSKEIRKSKKLRGYLQLIENENERLKSQVDKVLQIALLDSGNFQLDSKKIDLHNVIEQVAKSFQLILEEKKGTMDMNLKASNGKLYADATHISNIVYNLIDNAIKYSSENPHISIYTENTDTGISFSVKDNGIGMDADAQKFVFDKFYRAPTGNIHDVKGFGLGLSYVKSIVDAHKGSIHLNSKLRQGSEFTIRLPLAPSI